MTQRLRLRLPRLISIIRQGKAPSRRVAEKIGMQLDDEITRSGHAFWVYRLDRPSNAR